MKYRSDHIAVAILRQHDALVVIQQQAADDPEPYWVLPGGLVEPGELITDALIREVHEEAGVHITEIGHLACLSQIDRPESAMQTFAYVFEITAWHGVLESRDPDNEVVSVKLLSLSEAYTKLQTGPAWPGVRDPILAYLAGQMPAGTSWFYREIAGRQQMEHCFSVPGPPIQRMPFNKNDTSTVK